jgi:hypothetical protein
MTEPKCKCDLHELAAQLGQSVKVQPPCKDFLELADASDYCAFCEHARACHPSEQSKEVTL